MVQGVHRLDVRFRCTGVTERHCTQATSWHTGKQQWWYKWCSGLNLSAYTCQLFVSLGDNVAHRLYASGLHYYVKQSQVVPGKQCRQHMWHAVSRMETACTTHMLVEIIHNQMLMPWITSVFAGIRRRDVLHSCTTSMAPYIDIYIRRSFGTLFHDNVVCW